MNPPTSLPETSTMKGLKIERIRSLETLLRWRAEVLKAESGRTADAEMLKAVARYYDFHNADGSHVAFEARVPDAEGKLQPVGCGGVCFSEELPTDDNPTGRCANIINVYVREGYRGTGVGAALIKALLDLARFRRCGRIMVDSESKPEVLDFYRKLGFKTSPDALFYREISEPD